MKPIPDPSERIAGHIERLAAMCKAADHAIRSLYQVPVKITIVIRVPGLTRGDTLFGDDDPDEAIRAIERVVASRRQQ